MTFPASAAAGSGLVPAAGARVELAGIVAVADAHTGAAGFSAR